MEIGKIRRFVIPVIRIAFGGFVNDQSQKVLFTEFHKLRDVGRFGNSLTGVAVDPLTIEEDHGFVVQTFEVQLDLPALPLFGQGEAFAEGP